MSLLLRVSRGSQAALCSFPVRTLRTALFAVVLGLTLALTALPAGGTTHAQSAMNLVVPKVVGMRLDLATKKLRANGFRVFQNCGAGYDCTATKELWVSAQAPRGGTRFPVRTVITIYAALKKPR